jgi:cation transport regulator ChaC
MSSDDDRKDSSTSLLPLILAATLVVILWVATPLFASLFLTSWSEKGQLGDTFGAVNALFSGLAFAGVIYTIHLQRHELSLQRRELELTRQELKRTAEAQEASERALTKQAAALEVAARLNALSSVILHYPTMISQIASAAQRSEAERRHVDYVRQLEEMLTQLRAV